MASQGLQQLLVAAEHFSAVVRSSILSDRDGPSDGGDGVAATAGAASPSSAVATIEDAWRRLEAAYRSSRAVPTADAAGQKRARQDDDAHADESHKSPNAPSTSAATPSTSAFASAVHTAGPLPQQSLATLIAAGMLVPAEACISMTYKGRTYTADLTGRGTLIDTVNRSEFDHPSGWTLAVKRRESSGSSSSTGVDSASSSSLSSSSMIQSDNGWKNARYQGVPLKGVWDRYLQVRGAAAGTTSSSSSSSGINGGVGSTSMSTTSWHPGHGSLTLGINTQRTCRHVACTAVLSLTNTSHECRDDLPSHVACYSAHGPSRCPECKATDARNGARTKRRPVKG